MHIVLACVKFNITQVNIMVSANYPKLPAAVFRASLHLFVPLMKCLLIFRGQSESHSTFIKPKQNDLQMMTITLILTTKGTQDCSLGFGIISENELCGAKSL